MILSKGYQSALNWPICYSRFAFFLVARWQTGLYFMILDFVFIDRETMIVCFSLLCFVCTLCWLSLFYYLACSKVNMYITFCDKPFTWLFYTLFCFTKHGCRACATLVYLKLDYAFRHFVLGFLTVY